MNCERSKCTTISTSPGHFHLILSYRDYPSSYIISETRCAVSVYVRGTGEEGSLKRDISFFTLLLFSFIFLLQASPGRAVFLDYMKLTERKNG